MGSELKTQLLEKAALRRETLVIEDVTVVVREVGASVFAAYGAQVHKDGVKATAMLIADCVVDESGEPVLSIDDALVIAKSARMSMPIVSAIMRLSGFSEKETVAS